MDQRGGEAGRASIRGPLSHERTNQDVNRQARDGFQPSRSAVLVGIGLCLLVSVFFLLMPRGVVIPLPPCLFHQLGGWHCPGCGTGRAMVSLLEGRLLEAVGYNPILVLALPLLVGLLCRFRLPARWSIPGQSLSRLVLLVVASYWLLRNVPVMPFSLLAPGGPVHAVAK